METGPHTAFAVLASANVGCDHHHLSTFQVSESLLEVC